MKNAIIIYCTTPSSEVSEKICNYLIREQLAACCSILPGVKSVYRWNGAVESAIEELVMIKTKSENFSVVETAIKNMHPYEVPEIISLNINESSAEYLQWLNQNIRTSNET